MDNPYEPPTTHEAKLKTHRNGPFPFPLTLVVDALAIFFVVAIIGGILWAIFVPAVQ